MATSNKNKTQDETRPPSFMTRQGEMLEGVKEQLSSQFGLRFQRIEDAVATIAENMAALTQQVQAQLIKDETQDNEEISERHLQQPLILDQLLQNPLLVLQRKMILEMGPRLTSLYIRRWIRSNRNPQWLSLPTQPRMPGCFPRWPHPRIYFRLDLCQCQQEISRRTRSQGEQVKHILEATVTHLSAENSKPGFFPHKYICRGPEKHKATLNSLSLQEHL